MSSNLALPTDIILQILESESMDARDLLACLQVCHQLHDIISQSVTLTYKIRLFALGMCDNLQDDADIAHRSSMLTAYDEALRELKWTGYEAIDLQNMSDPCASDGLLVFRVIGHPAPPIETRLVVFQLPSALRGVRARRWNLNFDFSFSSFIIDASSDLLVLFCADPRHVQQRGLENHLHLCSLSAGDKHPLSQTDGVIRLSLEQNMDWWYWYNFAHSSRIRGDYLMFLMNSGQSLLLWNWHSGALVDMPLPLPCKTYSFLDDRRLVLVAGTLTTISRGHVRLLVYSLEKSAQNPGDVLTPCLEAIYMLPDDKIKIMRGRGDEVRLCSSPCRSVPAGHFYRDAAATETVLVLGIAVPGTSLFREFNLIIPVCALQTPAARHGGHHPASQPCTGNDTPGLAPEVPWSEWGRAVISDPFSNSRQSFPSGLNRLPFASGARTVMHELVTQQSRRAARTDSCSPARDSMDSSKVLVMTDYHPRRVAFAIARHDPRIRNSQSLSVGADAPHTGHTHAYLRVQATLPAQLQHLDLDLLCPVMCGDAVLLFQASERRGYAEHPAV
ncbi:hypothetical protein BC826DRAFT_1104768 [Russula brevipes]|nr:hypothetical protein BC826DRAFT_1104768 [Russula brevipes]